MAAKEGSRIFVGGLSPEVTDRDLERAFSRFGDILDCQVPIWNFCSMFCSSLCRLVLFLFLEFIIACACTSPMKFRDCYLKLCDKNWTCLWIFLECFKLKVVYLLELIVKTYTWKNEITLIIQKYRDVWGLVEKSCFALFLFSLIDLPFFLFFPGCW